MENIGSLLQKYKRPVQSQSSKPVNMNYEEARMFAQYCNLKIPFVLRLFKIYGRKKVLALKSWIKDYPIKGKAEGLIIWKLKGGVKK